MRRILMGTLIAIALLTTSKTMAQSFDKMQWFNEPEGWEIKNPTTFVMQVPGKTDYWRITHYGFTVDDAPFYYATYGGEFEVKVKITGNYKTTFDQMGLMLRTDHKNWIKTGVEYVGGKQNVSTVVTHNTSDWSVIELDKAPRSLWIKILRRLDAAEVFYSFDDKEYKMMRTCYLEDNCPVQVGLMGASPDGNGFEAIFEDFKVTQLPDLRRLKWAEKQK
ncbi:DUF1349 domain-containing protein [Bacteroides sp.]|uniref:DUF1349 domain-containing protein n=1 Tax=Bacteroides sp. TaxID=29523 RepID=UPI00260B5DA5|nr:DUF1349 domain-containing protein [Bacteroides sp.]